MATLEEIEHEYHRAVSTTVSEAEEYISFCNDIVKEMYDYNVCLFTQPVTCDAFHECLEERRTTNAGHGKNYVSFLFPIHWVPPSDIVDCLKEK